MKYRVNVVHGETGRVWHGKWQIGTQEQVKAEKESLKEVLRLGLTFIDMDDIILPGKFVENNCYFKFEINESDCYA